jgi:hypothetical protein
MAVVVHVPRWHQGSHVTLDEGALVREPDRRDSTRAPRLRRRSATVVGGWLRGAEPAYLQKLDPEGLQPGEEALQGRLIPQRAVHDGLDRLHRRGEPVEVKQRLGRENTGYPDLVIGR